MKINDEIKEERIKKKTNKYLFITIHIIKRNFEANRKKKGTQSCFDIPQIILKI